MLLRCLKSIKRSIKEVPLVKWKVITKSKEEGGWGLKNIHYFGNYLVEKILWRAISREILWRYSLEVYKPKDNNRLDHESKEVY
jgi:hypothetical protein